jgi:hypothetical protein
MHPHLLGNFDVFSGNILPDLLRLDKPLYLFVVLGRQRPRSGMNNAHVLGLHRCARRDAG